MQEINCKDIELVECPVCKGRASDLYTGNDCAECAGRGFIPATEQEIEEIEMEKWLHERKMKLYTFNPDKED